MASADPKMAVEREYHLSFVDKRFFERLLEVIPALITWTIIIAPILLSLFAPVVVAYFIIAFDLFWLLKSFFMGSALVGGYRRLHKSQKINWRERVGELKNLEASIANLNARIIEIENNKPYVNKFFLFSNAKIRDRNRYKGLKNSLVELSQIFEQQSTMIDPDDIYHVVIMPVYNEGLETLRPSIDALLSSNYNSQKIFFVIGYEERGGQQIIDNVKILEKEYSDRFGLFKSYCHPSDIPGEVIGKGGNITFAGRKILEIIQQKKIPLNNVIVTTIDSDNRVAKNYLNCLTYHYCIDPNRTRKSYQPVPMFMNNIWDVPAPVRVVASSNSFWIIIESMTPHRLRNFASHAQSLQTLVDTDFWSVTSPVEDGHQYWRTYFTYDGDHKVDPIYMPIYQDAVLSKTHLKTFRSQYVQLRRWAYGVSDFPFIIKNYLKNRQIGWWEKVVQVGRFLEGHISWATAPLILTFVAWLPLLLNSQFKNLVLAHQLPVVASRILTLAMLGIFVTIWISLMSLPPRPARYRKSKSIFMLTQWILMPVVAICFGSLAAIDAQTRLMFGRYLVFKVTDKVVKK